MTTAAVRDRLLLVGGEWIGTGEWIEVRSPYSGELVGRAAAGDGSHARAAVEAAERAMASPLPAHERARILERVSALLAERAEEIARLVCAEAGKPLKAARVEVGRATSTFLLAADEARRLTGEVVPMDATPAGAGKLAFTTRRPIGVVGAITPFNFPLNLAAHKLAPALAAGCAVVLKPADKTPLTAGLLAELTIEAGLPPGWLNVVTGAPVPIVDVLVEDPRVRALSFTGSAAVGWSLRGRAPTKRVLLELGNVTPAIVAASADLGAAAAKIAAGAFGFAGQSCISVQRVYVDRGVYPEFRDRFLAAVDELVVGDPADERTDVGPVIDASSRERILSWVAESGGTVLRGGEAGEDGLLPPMVVEAPSPGSRLLCDEVFGPVCTLEAFDDFDDALARAGGTRYGLQAGLFTNDLDQALRAAAELEFGAVLVNEAPTFRADQMPYGGLKESGNTREGPRYAIEELTEERLLVLQPPPGLSASGQGPPSGSDAPGGPPSRSGG